MKKALLVVHRYKSEDDDEWGSVAKDYGTSDLVENISKMHPSHDWRPATLTEARELMHKVKIHGCSLSNGTDAGLKFGLVR